MIASGGVSAQLLPHQRRVTQRHAQKHDFAGALTAARLFCVPRADVTAAQLASRYLNNLDAIARAAAQPGPYIYGVYPHEIKLLPLH